MNLVCDWSIILIKFEDIPAYLRTGTSHTVYAGTITVGVVIYEKNGIYNGQGRVSEDRG